MNSYGSAPCLMQSESFLRVYKIITFYFLTIFWYNQKHNSDNLEGFMTIQEKNAQRQLIISLYNDTFYSLSEKEKRLFAASFVLSGGHGTSKIVHEITGLSLPTIRKGVTELKSITEPETMNVSANDVIHYFAPFPLSTKLIQVLKNP